jgi:excisionase family DNA binding protein
MQTQVSHSDAAGPQSAVPSGSQPSLWTIDDFAGRLKCSTRHIRRLIDAGRAPAPIRLGALIRFDPAAVERWIQAGCPDLRRGGKSR